LDHFLSPSILSFLSAILSASILPPPILSPSILPPILSPAILSLGEAVGEPQPTIARLTPRPTMPAAISEKNVRILRLLWHITEDEPPPAPPARTRAPARRLTFVGCPARREVTDNLEEDMQARINEPCGLGESLE